MIVEILAIKGQAGSKAEKFQSERVSSLLPNDTLFHDKEYTLRKHIHIFRLFFLIGLINAFSLTKGFCATSLLKEQPRIWTSNGGSHQVDATLLEVKNDVVLLKRQDNGKTIRVVIEKLSPEDQNFLQQLANDSPSSVNATSPFTNFREKKNVEQDNIADIAVTTDLSVSLGGKNVIFGQPSPKVIATWGKPQRKETSMYGFEWWVYHDADYTKFIMVAMNDGVVCGLYTNSKGFQCNNGIEYGGTSQGMAVADVDVTVFTDQNADNTVHAVLLVSKKHKKTIIASTPQFLAVQSLECFDATNAFRVNHGKKPCSWDETASISATRHSLDMATNNFFSHTSLDKRTMIDRYVELTPRKWTACGENISAGRSYGIEAFDGWVNSPGHRDNMLNESFKYLGVGGGYGLDSDYRNYMTQVFITY